MNTVELRSKGPGRKGNPPIRENISSPIKHFLIYFYIGYKGISVYGKNKAGPLKSLGAKFHCTHNEVCSCSLNSVFKRGSLFSGSSLPNSVIFGIINSRLLEARRW